MIGFAFLLIGGERPCYAADDNYTVRLRAPLVGRKKDWWSSPVVDALKRAGANVVDVDYKVIKVRVSAQLVPGLIKDGLVDTVTRDGGGAPLQRDHCETETLTGYYTIWLRDGGGRASAAALQVQYRMAAIQAAPSGLGDFTARLPAGSLANLLRDQRVGRVVARCQVEVSPCTSDRRLFSDRLMIGYGIRGDIDERAATALAKAYSLRDVIVRPGWIVARTTSAVADKLKGDTRVTHIARDCRPMVKLRRCCEQYSDNEANDYTVSVASAEDAVLFVRRLGERGIMLKELSHAPNLYEAHLSPGDVKVLLAFDEVQAVDCDCVGTLY